jgi:hypothetical protein
MLSDSVRVFMAAGMEGSVRVDMTAPDPSRWTKTTGNYSARLPDIRRRGPTTKRPTTKKPTKRAKGEWWLEPAIRFTLDAERHAEPNFAGDQVFPLY